MRKVLLSLLSGVLLLSGLGLAGARTAARPSLQPSVPKPAGNVARGERFFQATCAICHGPDGRGKPQLGMNLAEPSAWMKEQTDEMLVAFVKQGRANSAAFKVPMLPRGGDPNLTDRDLVDIVAYMRTLQLKK